MGPVLAAALALACAQAPPPTEEAHVVRVSARWCAPCLEMEAPFRAAERAFAHLARFAVLDADLDAQAAARLGVRSLPATLIRFRGRTVERDVGYLTPGEQWALALRAALWPLLAETIDELHERGSSLRSE